MSGAAPAMGGTVPSGIFSPFRTKNVDLANRVVMAPMVRFGPPSEGGVMGERLMRDHLKRADRGTGLIISQAMSVSARREIGSGPGVCSDRHID